MTAIAIPRTARRRAIRRPDVSWLALRVWQRNRDVYFNVWKAELIWPLVEPLLTLIALGIGLGEFVEIEGQGSYIDYIGPGMLAVFPMWSAVSECAWGSFFRMDAQRTYDAIVATPASVDDVTTGEILWAATRALVTTVYLLVMITIFGAVDSPAVLLTLPLALFMGAMFGAISLCNTTLARSVSSLNYFFAAFVTPQFWLAGVFFPLSEMPKWVEIAAWFTPAYHVVNVYRGLAAGEWQWSYAGDLAWMGVVLLVFYTLALVLLRRRLVK